MKRFHVVFLVVLMVPFVEIYLLLQVGGVLGAAPTIFLVVLTAVIGTVMLRQQGLATWQRFQNSLAKGEIPAYAIIEGPIILVGGALLLTPGFITDLMGFVCLVPSLRKRIARYLLENYCVQAAGLRPNAQTYGVLDGEFRRDE